MSAKIRKAYDFLAMVNSEAYKQLYLLSNQVLSKNPYMNDFFKKYIQGKDVADPCVFLILYKLLRYYASSFKNFILYLFGFIKYYFFGSRFDYKTGRNELTLIDSFFNIEKIKRDNSFKDVFFADLTDLLKRLEKDFAYLPSFYDSKIGTDMADIFKIIKKQHLPVVCEYQLLDGIDLLRVFCFIIIYPFSVLRLAYRKTRISFESRILKSELIATLDQVTFNSFARYLLGKKIAGLPYKKMKIISWYENQVVHKNLYKGLRAKDRKVWICGAQLLIYSYNEVYIPADDRESVFDVLPDKILVNGPRFLPKNSRLNYSVGPSLRYCKLLAGEIGKTTRECILIALPYLPKEEVDNFCAIINNAIGQLEEKVLIKVHPALNINAYQKLSSLAAHMTSEDIYELFKVAKIVIGSAGGILVEAVSSGIPAIYLKNNTGIDFNPLPDYGKGIIWDEASSAEELKGCIQKLEMALVHHTDDINVLAYRCREEFFSQCDEESIRKAFEL